MRCVTCAGHGWVRNEAHDRELLPMVPCPRCEGSGWALPCEGNDASCEVPVAEPQPAIAINRFSQLLAASAR